MDLLNKGLSLTSINGLKAQAQMSRSLKEAFTLAGGFSVACNEVKCANVTTKRNERNFLKKFLKWSYQVVTARKIQDEAFTLAEVLITLAIIGVVAAISIPSVISNSQQQEFRTGLRKAVSVLNSAITMNMALDGETPYDNKNLYTYLQRHMGVLRSTLTMPYYTRFNHNAGGYINNGYTNAAFYTTDGMRFEFKWGTDRSATHTIDGSKLHESNITLTCTLTHPSSFADACGGCGSYGLNHNPNNTTKAPCLILVDVNGDKKPTPGNINCQDEDCARTSNLYKIPLPSEKKVNDIFSIMITEDRAIPYGVTAQKAMYNSQK